MQRRERIEQWLGVWRSYLDIGPRSMRERYQVIIAELEAQLALESSPASTIIAPLPPPEPVVESTPQIDTADERGGEEVLAGDAEAPDHVEAAHANPPPARPRQSSLFDF